MRIFLAALLAFSLASGAARAACEIHPDYNANFRKSLIDALYRVRNQQHLTQILYHMIRIDRETTAHEEAHYKAAQGWAERPRYEIVELYGKKYRIGGCVRAKPGIPLELAHRSALAPKRPSAHDLKTARKLMLKMQQLGLR
ncbi:MAG: hypothetical protein QF893_18665 [Alphaproteobacteria bacterium]|jgi:hypothetical protein|nr:hypothetical protein [Alphaproteobacteria bacterium]